MVVTLAIDRTRVPFRIVKHKNIKRVQWLWFAITLWLCDEETYLETLKEVK